MTGVWRLLATSDVVVVVMMSTFSCETMCVIGAMRRSCVVWREDIEGERTICIHNGSVSMPLFFLL